jgi:hypothetical protein
MSTTVYRMDFYERLIADREELLAKAEAIGRGLSIRSDLRGAIGTSGANSALPGSVREDIIEAMSSVAGSVVPPRRLGDEIRRVVKSVYGDDFDAAPTNSCEAALGLVYDALLTPPQLGRGETYRARCVGLLERHAEHQLSYGRPFPPLYKEVFSDRGSTAGELGISGRRAVNTDIVMVRMAGGRYEPHGPKMLPCPLLVQTDAKQTIASVKRSAEFHAASLAGFLTLGYDTPGYGYGDKNENGAPTIQVAVGALASSYGVPYVSDNAWGLPFIGTDPRQVGATVMLYSMDKVAGAPTSGLVLGREEAMVSVRRAMGIQSERFGATSAHGKAAHVAADPGKLSLAAMLQALRVIRDEPERLTGPVDVTHRIVLDEYASFSGRLGEGIRISKSYNVGGVEINYESTWAPDRMGIPIFSNEDRVAGSHVLGQCMAKMGVHLSQAEDANVIVTPGLGTVDRSGRVVEERMRLVVRALFSAMVLLREWATEQGSTAP